MAVKFRCPRVAFTLIELIVVIAIIATLLGLLIPAVQRVREASSRMSCSSNLRQLSVAVQSYHDVYSSLPVNSLGVDRNDPYGPQSHAWSWLARILPFIEQGNLFQRANVPNNTLLQSQQEVASTIKVFLCPSDDSSWSGPRTDAADLGWYNGPVFPPPIFAGQTNYKGVSGANWEWGDPQWHNPGTNGQSDGLTYGDGIFYRSDYLHPKSLTSITDGTSNTFMIGEDVPSLNHWCSWPYANNAVGTCAIAPNAKRADGTSYLPNDWFNVYSFHSRHPGGLQFAYADGSVHLINNAIDLGTYRAMATIQGGESITAP